MKHEIDFNALSLDEFINQKDREIKSIVGNNKVINTLSGGVDSSTVTLLAHNVLGDNLKSYFIDNGLMREGEPDKIILLFKQMGIHVEKIQAQKIFFKALKNITDPEEKREAITQTFYKNVFGKLVKETKIKYLLQGTNLTDIEETVDGIKRQHNVLMQLGIDTEKEFGYTIIEPLFQLRKPAIRKLAVKLGLPDEISQRPPFPGPALAARVIGEVTPKKIELVRKATQIVEDELSNTNSFQYFAILHNDKVTGVREGKREFGLQIEVRCWDSIDARIASPTQLPYEKLDRIATRITSNIANIVSVTYNITKKPPSTIEAI